MKKIIFFMVFLLLFSSQALAEDKIFFASCGNGTCESGEDKCTCAADCGECSGSVSGEVCQEYNCLTGLCRAQIKYYCCGNHICESEEDFSNCDADCAPSNIEIEIIDPVDSNVFMRGDEITFKVKVKADGVTAKSANVRVKTFAGDLPLYDDGNHSDNKANDGIYALSFLISELTVKNDYLSEFSAEKLGVSATQNFIVKVNPLIDLDYEIDKNSFILGETIHFTGTLFKRGQPVSTIINIAALNKGEKVFESNTRTDVNGFFSLDQRISLIYPEGNWHFVVSGLDEFGNQGVMEKTVIVSKELGRIFMDVEISSGYEKLYRRGQEVKLLVDVSFDEKPVEGAEVSALFPDGKEVDLRMVSKGKYSLSYLLPFDFPLGEQEILINAKKTIDFVKYGGSAEMQATIDNAKINSILIQPKKQTVVLGEELNFILKFNYETGMPLSKAKIWITINDKNIAATENEQGTFYFSYIVKNEDLSAARQLILNVDAVDAFENKVNFNRLFEVSGEITLEYYFRENPLLFLSVVFGFIFIILVFIVIRNRISRIGSLSKRKKELEKLRNDLQDRYFNLGAIGNEEYYSLLSKYGSELRDIDSAIEAFKKTVPEKPVEETESEEDVFGAKKASFDDSELGQMFSVKKKGIKQDEEKVIGLFSFKKSGKKEEAEDDLETEEDLEKEGISKEKETNLDVDLWGNEKIVRKEKNKKKENKMKKKKEEDDLWK